LLAVSFSFSSPLFSLILFHPANPRRPKHKQERSGAGKTRKVQTLFKAQSSTLPSRLVASFFQSDCTQVGLSFFLPRAPLSVPPRLVISCGSGGGGKQPQLAMSVVPTSKFIEVMSGQQRMADSDASVALRAFDHDYACMLAPTSGKQERREDEEDNFLDEDDRPSPPPKKKHCSGANSPGAKSYASSYSRRSASTASAFAVAHPLCPLVSGVDLTQEDSSPAKDLPMKMPHVPINPVVATPDPSPRVDLPTPLDDEYFFEAYVWKFTQQEKYELISHWPFHSLHLL